MGEVLQKTDVEYVITWVALPLSLLLLVMGTFAARYENKWFMVSLPFDPFSMSTSVIVSAIVRNLTPLGCSGDGIY
jgi:hypothetical protein